MKVKGYQLNIIPMKQVSLKEVNDRLWNKEGFRFEESNECQSDLNPITGKEVYYYRVLQVSVEELGIDRHVINSWDIKQSIIDNAFLVLEQGERLAPTYEELRFNIQNWG